MSSRKLKDFEFRLGKLGLGLFIFGTSVSLLFAFIFGVIVGKNIESYPKKIVKSIPNITRQKIIRKPLVVEETAKEEEKDFKLTFYETLGRKNDELGKSEEKKTLVENKYIIQVASFKDRKKAETLNKRLSDMGYDSDVDEIKLKLKGIWFRVQLKGLMNYKDAKKVVATLEKKIRGMKCMIVRDKK